MRTLPLGLCVVVALLLSSGSVAGVSDFELRPGIEIHAHDHEVAWDRQPNAVGYLFLRNGVVVSRTLDTAMATATFWKGKKYAVQTLLRRSDGRLVHGKRASLTDSDVRTAPLRSRFVLRFAPAERPPAFKLRLASQTAQTVTLAWKRQPGVVGYRFLRDGVVVSRTMRPSVTRATFWKGSRYAVVSLVHGPTKRVVTGRRALARALPAPSRGRQLLAFVAAPRPPLFTLRRVAQSPRTITLAWSRQPGAVGYRFLRNGVVISRTLNPRTTRATFWKGTSYAVDMLAMLPGKRVTPVRRALAFMSTAKSSSSESAKGGSAPAAPGGSGGGGGDGPSSGSGGSSGGSGRSSPPSPPTTPPAEPKPPSPPPPPSSPPTPPSIGPGGALTLSGSYSPSAFSRGGREGTEPPGHGDRGLHHHGRRCRQADRASRIDIATVQGTIEFDQGASGSSITNSSVAAAS